MAAHSRNRNYYDVLYVSRAAPGEIIRAAYRTLMQSMRHHPDLGGDPRTAALINEAYAVLTDAGRRAAYDRQLDAAGDHPGTASTAEPWGDPLLGCIFCRTPHARGVQIAPEDLCGECSSPLFPVEQRRAEGPNQRAVERVRKQQAIRFFTEWPQSRGFRGRMEDISPNGLRFTTRRELSVGQTIKIVGDALDAVARVSHFSANPSVLRGRNVAGVAFITLRFSSQVGGFVSRRV